MLVGYIQNNPDFGDVTGNISRIERLVRDVSFDLLVLPEFFASGYLFANRKEVATYAEEPGQGPITDFMARLARDKGAIIVGGFAECDGKKYYNSADMVTPEGVHRVYRKMHLFHKEKELFDKADDGFWVQETPLGRIGVMICFDWYFPEAMRTLALMGADIVAHPSNLVLPHCPEAMKTRALENRVFTITANRIGSDVRKGTTLSFIGQSRIYSPGGEMLAGSGSTAVEVRTVSINPALAREKLVTARNNLFSDRRPEHYRLA